jgi:NAD(P)-dependent dehydrogenase (short-subunit alcohol dehydrogenase family)
MMLARQAVPRHCRSKNPAKTQLIDEETLMAKDMKIALITGAGSGIGRCCAVAFLKAGYGVVLAGRRLNRLQETVKAAGMGAANSLCVPTDVTDPAQVKSLFDQCKSRFGRLDVLFNNAGISRGGSLESLSIEAWKESVDTNLSGPFYCTREAFLLMKDQSPRGGRIINNGSVSAYAPRPGSAPYTSTKHGILGLTKAAALDGRKFDIAVGQIDIGNALTEMAQAMTKGVPQADLSIAIEPTMDVAHVADAVLHMASLPLSANILTMTVMATKMPFVGRG